MKTLSPVRLVLMAILIAQCALCDGAKGHLPDTLIMFGAPRRAMLGMSREQIVTCMQGQPDEKLSADVWIYWDVRVSGLPPQYESYTALVILFDAGRVKLLRLADVHATKTLLARCRVAGGKSVPAR